MQDRLLLCLGLVLTLPLVLQVVDGVELKEFLVLNQFLRLQLQPTLSTVQA